MKNWNDKLLFWASFLTLIAAGLGFSMRGALLKTWGEQFGFTQAELGTIQGFGLVGFGITIIALSFFVDRVGYGPLMVLAFLLHFSSGVVTLSATVVFGLYGKTGALYCLVAGGLLFSLANGTCEAVINPLTATLFPKEKTHWLNILHAGWPGGLVLGAGLSVLFSLVSSLTGPVRWEVQMGMFLVPTVLYGVMLLGRRFPASEAAAAGVGLKTMLLEFASPILLLLLFLHALVGAVELGVDSWIQNITGSIMFNADYGKLLFIWTSALMFGLRFFAGPIVHKISPLGLLFASAVIACGGLLLLGYAPSGTAFSVALFCVIAATVYGIGKTFFWPTMLGVVSERYPRGGALTLGAIGGIGMLSAGIFGAPSIGFEQDYFASRKLQQTGGEAVFERYAETTTGSEDTGVWKAMQDPNIFRLFFPHVRGLDGSKVAKVDEADRGYVINAVIYGGQMALICTAAIPALMALGYLFLILYFKLRGGYKAEVLVGHAAEDEKFTGGVVGPAEP